MCSGSEYSLKDCQGYDPNNIAGDYCLSGSNQVGVMCIEGVAKLIITIVVNGLLHSLL